MEIVECIKKNDWYVHITDDGAYNAEREIALIKDNQSNFELAYTVGCTRLYFQTIQYKLIYPIDNYNDAWTYIKSVKGLIKTVETSFDEVMKDENLQGALGNVRLNRIIFEIKTLTNGKDCNTCVC
jgi:hypothetical protein